MINLFQQVVRQIKQPAFKAGYFLQFKLLLPFSALIFVQFCSHQVHPTFFGTKDLLQFLLDQATISIPCFEHQLIRFSNLWPPAHLAPPQCIYSNRLKHLWSLLLALYLFIDLLQLYLSQLIVHETHTNIALFNHLKKILFSLEERDQLLLILCLLILWQFFLNLEINLCDISLLLRNKCLYSIPRLLKLHLHYIHALDLRLNRPVFRLFFHLRLFLLTQANPHRYIQVEQLAKLILPYIFSIQISMLRDKIPASPLTFKSSLVRRKLNHPPAFPKKPKENIIAQTSLEQTHQAQFQAQKKRTKFSFRNASLNNAQFSPHSTAKRFEKSSCLGTEASQEIFQKKEKIQNLIRSLSQKKSRIQNRFFYLHNKTEQLKKSLMKKGGEVAEIIRSIKILM